MAAACIVVVGLLLGAWHLLDDSRLEPPSPALQQLDLLYLDEPAPGYERLGFRPGEPALLLVCDPPCAAPAGSWQVRHTTDASVARDYGLLTAEGRVGPGYALIDGAGRVRYRTFDPAPAAHGREIGILLGSLP